jgi:hypothetical protein
MVPTLSWGRLAVDERPLPSGGQVFPWVVLDGPFGARRGRVRTAGFRAAAAALSRPLHVRANTATIHRCRRRARRRRPAWPGPRSSSREGRHGAGGPPPHPSIAMVVCMQGAGGGGERWTRQAWQATGHAAGDARRACGRRTVTQRCAGPYKTGGLAARTSVCIALCPPHRAVVPVAGRRNRPPSLGPSRGATACARFPLRGHPPASASPPPAPRAACSLTSSRGRPSSSCRRYRCRCRRRPIEFRLSATTTQYCSSLPRRYRCRSLGAGSTSAGAESRRRLLRRRGAPAPALRPPWCRSARWRRAARSGTGLRSPSRWYRAPPPPRHAPPSC